MNTRGRGCTVKYSIADLQKYNVEPPNDILPLQCIGRDSRYTNHFNQSVLSDGTIETNLGIKTIKQIDINYNETLFNYNF